MKYFLLFFTASILFVTNSFSQIKQGTWMTGGSLGFNGTSANDNGSVNSHSKNFNINLELGYFLRNNLVIGLSPQYSYSNNVRNYSNGSITSNSNLYGVSPFIRKYIKLFNSTYIFGQAAFNIGFSNIKTHGVNSNNTFTKGDAQGLFLSPGINYFITNRIALEVIFAGLHLSTGKNTTNQNVAFPNNRTYTYGFNLNLASISLGVQFFLGKKEEAAKKEGM